MRNLWRVLALAWLGGIASPALTDDLLLPDQVVEDDDRADAVEEAPRQAPADVPAAETE
jgi:hypothetical protein